MKIITNFAKDEFTGTDTIVCLNQTYPTVEQPNNCGTLLADLSECIEAKIKNSSNPNNCEGLKLALENCISAANSICGYSKYHFNNDFIDFFNFCEKIIMKKKY